MPTRKKLRMTKNPRNLQSAIRETAWKQIAESGAATLSLRAIGRELGITAPAIYNYYPRRDDLVTSLIIEAYTSFGDALTGARDAVPDNDLIGRLRAIGLAYRRWAHTHPQRYQLIFGTPVPGYQPPMEKVLPFGARALSAMASIVERLRADGRLRTESLPEVQDEYKAHFELWKKYGGDMDILSLSVAVLIWAHVHGIVSLEIAGYLPPFGAEGDGLYRYELDVLYRQFIKEP